MCVRCFFIPLLGRLIPTDGGPKDKEMGEAAPRKHDAGHPFEQPFVNIISATDDELSSHGPGFLTKPQPRI